MSSSGARSVFVVTGNRAEYDIQYPVLEALRARGDVRLRIVVTGAHLSPFHGETVREIEADGFTELIRIPTLLAADTPAARALGLASQIDAFARLFEREHPDIVLACGDREEVLAAAVACIYLNVIFAHYAAGDEAFDGNVDNAVRHAASKLAHLMLVTHPRHRDLLLASGERGARVHVVGDSGLDRIRSEPVLSEAELESLLPFSLPPRPRALMIHHSMTTTIETAHEEVRNIFVALKRANINGVVSYPNTDAGNVSIRRVVDEECRSDGYLAYSNLARSAFVNLARSCDFLIGNSSMGILEAPLLSLPAINVGQRQRLRLRGDNVVFCTSGVDAIAEAIRRVQVPAFRAGLSGQSPYGDGRSGERIASIVAETELSSRLRFKTFEALRAAFVAEP